VSTRPLLAKPLRKPDLDLGMHIFRNSFSQLHIQPSELIDVCLIEREFHRVLFQFIGYEISLLESKLRLLKK
jgi:hypothetical protein